MKHEIKSAIRHMVQGLAHWMAYRDEMSYVKLIEADAVFMATDILRANLPYDYVVRREVTKKTLAIVDNNRIDLGIISRKTQTYECLIEFKLADATNKGYMNDVERLSKIKQQNKDVDCLVVILFRKSCLYNEPEEFVDTHDGSARKGIRKDISPTIPVKVRAVCHSFPSVNNHKSKKTICLEIL